MTLKQAAEQAIQVQDASNLSGVLNSLHEIVMTVIRPEADKSGRGTRWINQHPIVYMFLYKLMALNGHEPLGDWDTYHQMEKACKGIIAAEEIGVMVEEVKQS